MNRLARSTLCLLLVGLLGMGSVGLGLCICADGGIELRTGCCGDCRNADDMPDGQQHSGTAMSTTPAAYSNADCTYVPLSSEAMLLASSQAPKSPLLSKSSLVAVYPADCLNSRSDGLGSKASRAQCFTSTLVSASLLAQRTVVLRI